jgi:ketosteroid isomerase-like protein
VGADDLVRAELVRVESEWATAIVDNDAQRVGAYMTEDWVMVSEWGVTTREQFLGNIRSGALTHSAMDTVGEAAVRRYGETAVLIQRVKSTAAYGGESSDADEWTSDVFTRTHGQWRCATSHITAVRAEG